MAYEREEKVSKKKIMNMIIIILFATLIFCGIIFYRELKLIKQETSRYETMQDAYTTVNYTQETVFDDESIINPDDNDRVPPEWAGLPLLDVDFESLLENNPDTVGWIAIPYTPINYPVVQTTNNRKYLTTSFDGEYSRTGTPFVDCNNNIYILDTNTIIYGHNMGSGRDDMFGSLLEYKDYDYFTANRYIQFDTINRKYGWWEIFAVIEYDVRSNAFEYLQINFNSSERFMDWVERVKELSIHNSNTEITPYDRILTLSTCDRGTYGRNGRVLILAVNVSHIALG